MGIQFIIQSITYIRDKLSVYVKKSFINNSSVSTAECIALNETLDLALQHTYCNVMVFTDFLSVLIKLKLMRQTIQISSY